MSSDSSHLGISQDSEPLNVPVFNCIVYVTTRVGEGVSARVANLAGIECTANSEREALSQIIPAFKQRISEIMQKNSEIPWIDPPAKIEAGEQQRLIPVHL